MGIRETLELHRKWLRGESGGVRANFSCADLRYKDLSYANLTDANFSDANLTGADLTDANFSDANLTGADLTDANLICTNLTASTLTGTDLTGAKLWGCIGNRMEVKSVQIDTYSIAYTADRLQIGCQNHTIEDWWGFNDRRILEMDGKGALTWWRKWKPLLQQIIAASPATPTGHEVNK